MQIETLTNVKISDARDVLMLFTIPIGGGIPAGVVLAQSRGIAWPVVSFLYFVSDLILACAFEPLMLLFLHYSTRVVWVARLRLALAQATHQTVSRFSLKPGPFALVMITLGTDPMTGRSMSKAVGHGFLTGWTLTILGDMIFFGIIMVSTLWLNNLLGDGTWAAVIIMVAMIAIPSIIRKIRQKKQ
jgi:hypothetical protein